MSLVRRSLSFSSCGILHPSSGFKHRDFAGAWLLSGSRNQLLVRTQPADFLKQPLRVANVVRAEGNGRGENSVADKPYPSAELEISSTDLASVTLNEVAPPVGNVFGSSAKEVNILEDPVGFFKYRLERKAQKVKKAIESVEEAVAPSPYSPVQGDDVVIFFCISVFLILLFWVGNYVAPTWIFKETVFRNSKGNSDDNVEVYGQDDNAGEPSEDEVDPADLIELPTNLMPFRGAAVAGFKAGRQRARDAAEKRRKKKAEKSK